MAGRKRRVDPLPENFASIKEAAEFWDKHDTADYWEFTRPVTDVVFDIKRRRYLVALDPSLSKRLDKVATQQGVSGEALLNRWVKERLDSLTPRHGTKRRRRESGERERSRKLAVSV
jgi:hypothetical protein